MKSTIYVKTWDRALPFRKYMERLTPQWWATHRWAYNKGYQSCVEINTQTGNVEIWEIDMNNTQNKDDWMVYKLNQYLEQGNTKAAEFESKYPRVRRLYDDPFTGKPRENSVHKMVFYTFASQDLKDHWKERTKGMEVHHIDHNVLNSDIKNLDLTTREKNRADRKIHTPAEINELFTNWVMNEEDCLSLGELIEYSNNGWEVTK